MNAPVQVVRTVLNGWASCEVSAHVAASRGERGAR